MYPLDDTIAAIASPPGGAARGILRISGPQAIECVSQFFYADDAKKLPLDGRCCMVKAMESANPPSAIHHPPFPHAIAGSLCVPELHSPLPCDVYVWSDAFGRKHLATSDAGGTPAPQVRSYTGQPVVEIHTLGSPPLLQVLLRTLCAAGARLAGPGEFTLRAFLAGRLDLTQAEAVLGVIDANDSRELNTALGQLAGGLARPLHRVRDALLDLLAHVEAGFDFADEELPFITRE
jgi:tRNA modification GTPase